MDAIYDELFALRIQYMDTMDENNIIRRLKQKLFDEYNVPYDLLNEQLHLFYITYDIDITLSEIENVDIDEEEEEEEEEMLPNNVFSQLNQFMVQLENILNLAPGGNMEDVVVTTDMDSIKELPVLKIISDGEKCTICMDEMKIDDEYIDIQCKHIFHKECLTNYLKDFNHICPVCRVEIGKSKINL